MAIAIDVHGVGPGDYRFAVSPLAELCAVLHVIAEPGHHREQREWIDPVVDRLPVELIHELRRMDYLFRTSRPDMFLPDRPRASITEELDVLDRLSDEAWVSSALLTSSCGSIPLVDGAASPLADVGVRKVALDRARARGVRAGRFVETVLADPSQVRRAVRAVFEACDSAFFATVWQRVEPHLARDARRKRDLLRTTPTPGPTLAEVSPWIGLSDDGSRLLVDKVQDGFATAVGTGVTFLPSVFGSPHLLVVYAQALAPVVQYPVPGVAPDVGPDSTKIRRRLHALDNPIRFRLARSLARGPRTTSELAELWNLSNAEVSRHLAVLKEAGVASAERQGRHVVYLLDVAVLHGLGTDLHAVFLR
jgi:DNA-binding transcriptional ArsR family regulator